jgi:2-oxoglutaroyl-CoA hydrolase
MVITMAEREQLRVAFEILDADPGVRVIVLRAMGEHFSSGSEIGGFLEASPEHVSRLAWNVAVNRGYCLGVAFELSLACDFRLASETGLYALPEQRPAQIPGSGGAARLQKMVGISRAKDIVSAPAKPAKSRECKSLTVKVQRTTLAPSHASTSVKVKAKR